MATQKKVLGIRQSGSTHWVGDGFHVRNLFPSNGIEDELTNCCLMVPCDQRCSADQISYLADAIVFGLDN
jgi:hypothetical protein